MDRQLTVAIPHFEVLASHNTHNCLQSPLLAGFMDDFTVGGPEVVVYRDIAVVTSTGTSLGLHLNVAMCELVHPQGSAIKFAVLGSFKSIALDEATLLGAPLLPSKNLDTALDMCCSNLSKAISYLSHIEAHDALVLLRSCFCAPKIQHILRCTPCHGHPALTTFDNLLKSGLMVVTNCNLSDVQWLQTSLPVRDGGLGIRRAAPLALSAFLASAAGTLDLQNEILVNVVVSMDTHVADYEVDWSILHSMLLPAFSASAKQAVWTLQPSWQTRPLFRAATVAATTRQGFQLFLHHTATIGFTHFRSLPAAYVWIMRPSESQLVWDLVQTSAHLREDGWC